MFLHINTELNEGVQPLEHDVGFKTTSFILVLSAKLLILDVKPKVSTPKKAIFSYLK